MKTKTVFLIAAGIIMFTPFLRAQTPAAPGDYKLDNNADFAKYEGKVKEYTAWYEKAPLNENEDLHKEIGAFLVKWISGAPNVTVNIGDVAVPIIDEKDYKYNGNMLIAYMGGVAVYELNNPSEKDEAKIETAGVDAVMEMYKNNTSLLSDSKAIKKYKKMQDKGELDKWIKDCVNKASK